MSATDTLPVLVVSAVDQTAADKIISEVCGDEVSLQADRRVWSISTKYYTARVAVEVATDGAGRGADGPVEAHLIYLTPDEGADVAALERRLRPQKEEDVVRVVCGERGVPWEVAVAAHYEPVSLTPQEGEEDEEEGPAGVERVREALMAHTWSGLVLQGGAAAGDETAEDGWQGAEWERVWSAVSEAGRLSPERRRAAAGLLAEFLLRAPR